MKILHIEPYDENNLARVVSDEGWFLMDKEERQVGDTYVYIERWGDEFYKVERGVMKNLMRTDGSLVLKEWHHAVYKITRGFFFFSNTIRKSKTNPRTRYTYGLAHVSGDVIFPMIFSTFQWTQNDELIYAEIDKKPYLLALDGSIFDPMNGHLPTRRKIDDIRLLEKIINWTLPGLQFFYRDTDAPIDVEQTYHVGDTIRAGFYIDMTTKLLRPVHKTRFLIASAHAAMLCKIDDLCSENPNVDRWGLCTLHFNSYLKVMDIYKRDGVIQIFLLHIPEVAMNVFGNGVIDVNFVNQDVPNAEKLVDMAHSSLDEKLSMDIHPRSMDEEFVARMHHPVGLDNDYHLVPLVQVDESLNEGDHLSRFIHRLADDAPIETYEEVDNFPYTGVEGTVCKGCIYTRGIQGNGMGCGRLFAPSFRLRYIKGNCEYKKIDLFTPSVFELKAKEEKRLAKEAEEKSSNVYALKMLRSFIDERLDGDITKLKYFDFNSLKKDNKYGDNRDRTVFGTESMLAKSVFSLAFSDVWQGLNYELMDKRTFQADTINFTNTLFGIHFEDYYKALETFRAPQSLRQRVVAFEKMVHTIGNIMVIPFCWNMVRDTRPLGRGYTDVFLREVYKMMTKEAKFNRKLLDNLNHAIKDVDSFRTKENFTKMARGLMLDDFLDDEGRPKQVFQGLFSWEHGIDRPTFLRAANEFLDFCEPFIDKRADKIIKKIEPMFY